MPSSFVDSERGMGLSCCLRAAAAASIPLTALSGHTGDRLRLQQGTGLHCSPWDRDGAGTSPARLWPCQGVRGDRRGSLQSRWERSRLLGVQINLPSARAKSPTFSTLTKFSFYGCRVPPFPYFLEWSPNSFSHSLIKTWLSFPSWKSRDPHSSNMACCH